MSIGHRAEVPGCALGDRVLAGMGGVILDRCPIGEDSLVGAGSVVPEGSMLPPRSAGMGVPGKRVREAAPADLQRIVRTATEYKALTAQYREQG